MYMDVLASRRRAVLTLILSAPLGCLSLKNQGLLGRRCSLPVLSMCWKEDVFSPKSESELIVRSSADGKLVEFGHTPVLTLSTNRWMRPPAGSPEFYPEQHNNH